jgi:hypothetical protein
MINFIINNDIINQVSKIGCVNIDIGNIFSDSIGYPTRNIGRVLVLGVLMLFSILIIPLFLVLGYALKIIKESTKEGTEPPEFDNWGAMFIDGLKYLVVSIVYFLIPLIVMGIGIISAVTSIPSNDLIGSKAAYINLILGSGLFLIGLLLLLVIVVILNIAIANMAHKGEFGAAFKFGEIFHVIGSIGWGKYIICYIVLIVIAMVISIVTSIVASIPLLGFILIILLAEPYSLIFSSRAIGLIYKEGI